jgi:Flp pilus assembly protein TadG
MPQKTKQIRSGFRARRGGAAMEMMLVLPIMFMLSFGVVDYGYLLFVKNTVEGAAQAGVRAGIPSAATNTSVTAAVGNVMTAAGIGTYTTTITDTSGNALNVSGLAAGTMIQVNVNCTWGNVGTKTLGQTFGGMSNSKVISGTAVMQKESS